MTYNSRNDITSPSEENKTSETRNKRSNKRDIVNIPDGKGGFIQLTRSPENSLGKQRLQLTLESKEGMYRQWISDEVSGNLQRYINLGFTPVTLNGGNLAEPVRGGVRRDNTVYNMYALEIEQEVLNKLIALDKLQNPTLLAAKKQEEWLEGQQNSEIGTYHPTSNEVKVL